MPDVMSPEKRSALMGRIRAKDTTPERYIRELLTAGTISFEQHDKDLPGKPDFSFPADSVAVFIDGDFWHGWYFPTWSHRLQPFWRDKIATTRKRDRRNFARLRRKGWRVIRIWEHQIEQNVLSCVNRITEFVSQPVDEQAISERLKELPPLKHRKRLPKP
ncbi:MAG: very short patch repair endonuclease [Pirellulales bacterium]|nr:very short patch repair endonuclease [Pirellulales bacterium]